MEKAQADSTVDQTCLYFGSVSVVTAQPIKLANSCRGDRDLATYMVDHKHSETSRLPRGDALKRSYPLRRTGRIWPCTSKGTTIYCEMGRESTSGRLPVFPPTRLRPYSTTLFSPSLPSLHSSCPLNGLRADPVGCPDVRQ